MGLVLSNADIANCQTIAGFVEEDTDDTETAEWFRTGLDNGEPLPENIAAVEAGIQFLRTYLSKHGNYKESAPYLAKRLTALVENEGDQKVNDMHAMIPDNAVMPTPIAPPVEPPASFAFVGLSAGDTLSGPNHVFSWTHPDADNYAWDVHIRDAVYGPFSTTDSSTPANLIYNSTGLLVTNTSNANPTLVVPTDGRMLNVRVLHSAPGKVWSNWDAVAENAYIDITVQAATISDTTISTAGLSVYTAPAAEIPEGSWTDADWGATLPAGTSLIFSSLNANVSSKIINGDMYQNFRMDPVTDPNATTGSTRPEVGFDIPDAESYRIVYKMIVPVDYSYGVDLSKRTAKLGPGFASDKIITGASPDTDGFSVRMNMRSDNTLGADEATLAMYSYFANRVSTWGDDLPLLNEDGSPHIIQKGSEYTFGLFVKMNTAAGNADGQIKVWMQVNGGDKWLALERTNIEWWGSGTPSIQRILWQMFHGGNSWDWRPSKSNDICFKIEGWAVGDFNSSVTTATMSFSDIRAAGRPLNGYPIGAEYTKLHLGEFLFLNPDCCSWSMDTNNQTITALPDPEPPSNSVYLPEPSGGNDSATIQSFINSNPGMTLVGTGDTYQLGTTLNIQNEITIFDMPTRLTGTIQRAIDVHSPNVKIHRSPIDMDQRSTAYGGIRFYPSATGGVFSKSGVINMRYTGSSAAYGIYLNGSDNYMVACNQLNNLHTTNPDVVLRTIWDNSSLSTVSAPRGYVVNNTSQEVQAQVPDNFESFYARQGYAGSIGDSILLGNRILDGGKRFVKAQHGDVFIASNEFEWDTEIGPMGTRKQLNIINVQLNDTDNVRTYNNRFTLHANGTWGEVFKVAPQHNSYVYKNLKFNFNDIHIRVDAAASHYGAVIRYANKTTTSSDTLNQLIDNEVINNVIRGPGKPNYYFSFQGGYEDDGSQSGLNISGNDFRVPALLDDFQGLSINYVP